MIDAFRVGVTIAMASNGASVLGELMRHLTGVEVKARELEGTLRGVKLAAVGALGVFGGAIALRGIWSVIDSARDLNAELERTKQLGGDFAKNIGSIRAGAFGAANEVQTLTPSQGVRLTRELGGVLMNPKAATALLPEVARLAHVVSHYTGENEESIIRNLVKVADLRAKIFSIGPDGKEAIDWKKLTPELEAAAKGLILAGNYLKSGDLLALAKQAGVPIKGMTAEALYAALVEMAVSQGASRAGTATTSLMQQLVGGTMTAKTAVNMERAGLLKHGDWYSDHGHVVVRPSGMNRFKDAEADPIAWLTGEGKAKIEKYAHSQGISMVAAVYQLFGRQTTQRLVAEALSAGPQFARARELFHDIPNVMDQWKELNAHDLTTNIQGITAAWKGMMQAFGEAGIPTAIGVMHQITSVLHEMMMWAAQHPETAARIEQTGAAIAGLAVVMGSAMVLAMLGPGGWMVGIGTAAVAMAAGLQKLDDFLHARFSWLYTPDQLAGKGIGRGVPSGMKYWDIGSPEPPNYSMPDFSHVDNRPVGAKLKSLLFGTPLPPPPPLRYGRGGGDAIPVIIMNPHDIATGVTGFQSMRLSRPSTGSTGLGDFRMQLGDGVGALP